LHTGNYPGELGIFPLIGMGRRVLRCRRDAVAVSRPWLAQETRAPAGKG